MVRRLDPWFVFIHCGGDTDRQRSRIVKRFLRRDIFAPREAQERLRQRVSATPAINWRVITVTVFHRYAALAAASFLLNKVRTAFISVNGRRAAFTFHSSLSGLSQEITAPGEICRLAIVGLLIPLFASWLVMRRGCRRGLGRRWRLQKKLQ